MARSIVSRVMFATSAAFTAARRRGFIAGSGMPCLAETVISRISLPKAWARLAPWAALRCMTFLACEWPAMAASLSSNRCVGWRGFYRPGGRPGKRGLENRPRDGPECPIMDMQTQADPFAVTSEAQLRTLYAE